MVVATCKAPYPRNPSTWVDGFAGLPCASSGRFTRNTGTRGSVAAEPASPSPLCQPLTPHQARHTRGQRGKREHQLSERVGSTSIWARISRREPRHESDQRDHYDTVDNVLAVCFRRVQATPPSAQGVAEQLTADGRGLHLQTACVLLVLNQSIICQAVTPHQRRLLPQSGS